MSICSFNKKNILSWINLILSILAIIYFVLSILLVTEAINEVHDNARNKTCCLNYGGNYKNGVCEAFPGYSFDIDAYNECTN